MISWVLDPRYHVQLVSFKSNLHLTSEPNLDHHHAIMDNGNLPDQELPVSTNQSMSRSTERRKKESKSWG